MRICAQETIAIPLVQIIELYVDVRLTLCTCKICRDNLLGYRKPCINFAMFAHNGRAGYVDDPLPNIVYRMPACIIWLYYASGSTVWYHFFLLNV